MGAVSAILTRELSGLYSITTRPMVIEKVDGETLYDAYVAPGDGLGIRHLCPSKVDSMFGVELRRLESIAIELSGHVVHGAKPIQVRQADQAGE